MNISLFEKPIFVNNQIQSFSVIEEGKRLANEFRSKPERTYINKVGTSVTVPAKIGFDIETCTLKEITNYLDNRKKKSKSQINFLYRIMSVRFPVEFTIRKRTSNLKLELEIIESESKNDPYWFGEVGYQNMVSYTDPKINNPNLKTTKLSRDRIKITRK